MKKNKKTIVQHIKWWWNTRVIGFFRIKLLGRFRRRLTNHSNEIKFDKDAVEFTQSQTQGKGVTVILTAYRRAEYLAEQIHALRKQTFPPEEIWVWSNRSEEELIDISSLADRVVVSNTNWKFWGRFALANLVRTEFVAFFDDDILPQPKWFENCLATIENGFDGILGGSGVILPAEGGYSSKNKAGWNGKHSSSVTQVDLVGHAWFMRKSIANYMWREEPAHWDNGEDIHLSYMALKHADIKTYVPPHPESDQSLWSCRPDFGKVVGRTKVATYKTSSHRDIRSEIVNQYCEDGWQVLSKNKESQFGVKEFTSELQQFNEKLRNDEPFSLVRFGDGEMLVINGEAIDLLHKFNGEHKYTPNDSKDEHYRKILTESLMFKNDNYFVGLACRCCVGDEYCEKLRYQSRQAENQLTWANIFVNANYPVFIQQTVPILSTKSINLICHEKASFIKLPFSVKKDFRVGANAWVEDYERLVIELSGYIKAAQINNEVFIFCAGVLSNMLIYQLAKDFPENTYLDVGSVFDDILGLGKTRKYLKGSKRRMNKVCVW